MVYFKQYSIALLLLSLLYCGSAFAEKIAYKLVAIGAQDGEILLDLVEEYELSDTMLEALDSGVPLTFETHFKMRDDDSFLWQKSAVNLKLRRVLRYHPLATQYEVHNLGTGDKQKFATLAATLRFLGDVRSQKIISLKQLNRNAQYNVEIQTTLDISSLPLPLRPLAYVSPSWHLSSRVYEWRLNP